MPPGGLAGADTPPEPGPALVSDVSPATAPDALELADACSVGAVVGVDVEVSSGVAVTAEVGVGSIVGAAVCRAVCLGVGRTVGRAVGVRVGVGVGVGVAVGVAVGVGVGLGHALVPRPWPALKWTAAAYGSRIRAAGTWLVVKALSPEPG